MKRILVCLDASPRAVFVLQTATDLAAKTGAKLVLLRSVGLPAEIDQEFYVHAAGSMTDMLVDKAKKELDVLSKDVPAGLIEATTSTSAPPGTRSAARPRPATAIS